MDNVHHVFRGYILLVCRGGCRIYVAPENDKYLNENHWALHNFTAVRLFAVQYLTKLETETFIQVKLGRCEEWKDRSFLQFLFQISNFILPPIC